MNEETINGIWTGLIFFVLLLFLFLMEILLGYISYRFQIERCYDLDQEGFVVRTNPFFTWSDVSPYCEIKLENGLWISESDIKIFHILSQERCDELDNAGFIVRMNNFWANGNIFCEIKLEDGSWVNEDDVDIHSLPLSKPMRKQ